MPFCGKCGQPLVNGTCPSCRPAAQPSGFCGKCGRPLVNGTCPSCRPTAQLSGFCGKCGRPLVNGICPSCRPAVRFSELCPKCGKPIVNGRYSCSHGRKVERSAKPFLIAAAAVIVLFLLGTGVLLAWNAIEDAGKVTVCFDVGSDPTIEYAPAPQMIPASTCAVPVKTPCRDGFCFLGWYRDQELTQKFDFTESVEFNLTLYAKWVRDSDFLSAENSEYAELALLDMESVLDELLEFRSTKSVGTACQNEDELNEALQSVAEYAAEQQNAGRLGFYITEETCVYMETTYGIPIVYQPVMAGMSGGGIAFDPFADDINRYEGGRNTPFAGEGLSDVSQVFEKYNTESYVDSEVNLQAISSIQNCNVFLWDGHGGYSLGDGPSLLLREEYNTGNSENYSKDIQTMLHDHSLVLFSNDNTVYFSVTAKFFRKHVTWKIDHGLVYLSTCFSGKNNMLANAMRDLGAETVFVNTDTINTRYTEYMMRFILWSMTGEVDQIYHTAADALAFAHSYFREKLEKVGQTYQNRSYSVVDGSFIHERAEVQIVGETDYTIVSGIKGTIRSSDESIDLTQVSARVCQNEKYTEWAGVQSDGCFYVNKLDEGRASLEFYSEGYLVGTVDDIEIRNHRYTDIGEVDLRLPSVRISVVDQEKTKAVPDAKVIVKAVYTTENGKVDVEPKVIRDDKGWYIEAPYPGVYIVTASAEGYVSTSLSQDVPAVCQSENEKNYSHELTVQLRRKKDTGIEGQLRIGSSEVSARNITAVSDGRFPEEKWDGLSSGSRFRITGIEPGTTALNFFYDGKLISRLENITVRENEMTDVGTVTIQLSKLAVRVVDGENGKNIKNAEVTIDALLAAQHGGGQSVQCELTRSWDSWQYTAAFPGTYMICAAADGYAMVTKRVTIEPTATGTGGVQEITIQLPKAVHTPEETIQALEDAMNNLDQAALLECFDAGLNAAYYGIMGAAGIVTGLPVLGISALTEELSPLLQTAGIMPTVRMRVTDVQYTESGKDCIVTIESSTAVTMYGENHSNTETAQLPMHLVDDRWLISLSGLDQLIGLIR